MTANRFYVDEDGYGEPCVWYGKGPESRDDKLVLRKHNLDREGVELWPMVSAALLAYSTAPGDGTAEAAQQREERAVAEARPHDEEPVLGDVIKCQQCGQQTRSISRGCSVCGLGMARLDEPGKDAGHVWMPYPDEPGRRCTCSIGHDHDEDPSDGPSQAQEVRAAAGWPAEPVGDRYDELAADRHAEITEAERSEEVHGG